MDLEVIASTMHEQSLYFTYNLYSYGLIGAAMGLFSSYLTAYKNKKSSERETSPRSYGINQS